MKMSKIAKSISVMALVILMGPGIASAFSIGLTNSNVSGLPDITYATVNGYVDGSDNSIFHFSINLPGDLSTTLKGGSNFGMDKFFFNTNLALNSGMFKNFNPTTWSVAKNGNGSGGFGKFSIQLKDIVPPRPTTLSFEIDYTEAITEDNFLLPSSGNAGNGNGYFAVHIGGFDYNGADNSTFASSGAPIPEPSTMLLLGTGMVGLVFYNRRTGKK